MSGFSNTFKAFEDDEYPHQSDQNKTEDASQAKRKPPLTGTTRFPTQQDAQPQYRAKAEGSSRQVVNTYVEKVQPPKVEEATGDEETKNPNFGRGKRSGRGGRSEPKEYRPKDTHQEGGHTQKFRKVTQNRIEDEAPVDDAG